MLKEIMKDIKNPKILVKAFKNKYGYTHSVFVDKLIKVYKKGYRNSKLLKYEATPPPSFPMEK